MIVDASVILSALFPDEVQAQAQAVLRDHVMGRVPLAAPTLLVYEVTNAVVQARRRGRINDEKVSRVLTAYDKLGIVVEGVSWQQILPLALRFECSVYDAAYLALAEMTGRPLVTGDRRLYNAVHEHLGWVRWLGGE